jgi:hypothetical protein
MPALAMRASFQNEAMIFTMLPSVIAPAEDVTHHQALISGWRLHSLPIALW